MKQPLSQAGVDAKQKELAALSPAALEVQALLIRDEFKQWVQDNFVLSSVQQTYLNMMDDKFATILSTNVFIAAKFNVPVVFEKAVPVVGKSKLMADIPVYTATYSEAAGTYITGHIKIEITYN